LALKLINFIHLIFLQQREQIMRTKFLFLSFSLSLIANSSNVAATPLISTFNVTCATTGSQICDPEFSTSVTTTTQWQPIQLKYDVDPSHCSSVRLHIFVDGMAH
jgi:hypothetical protein